MRIRECSITNVQHNNITHSNILRAKIQFYISSELAMAFIQANTVHGQRSYSCKEIRYISILTVFSMRKVLTHYRGRKVQHYRGEGMANSKKHFQLLHKIWKHKYIY